MIQTVSPAPAAELADVVRAAHHQIGNSLQSIASLLRMESRAAPPAAAAILTEAGRRVRTIMHLHQRLQEGGVAVRLDDLLGDVCRDVAELDAFGRPAEMQVDIHPLWATPKVASALAMITAEWVGNALEHGLGDRPGRVEVTLEPTGSGARLVVADSGHGDADGEWRPGFGMALVASLARQIGGRIDRTAGRRGARCVLELSGPSLDAVPPEPDKAG
jgi:two-component sensor histidine kinase